jgi:excisionase family DNA binding protein
MDAQDLSRTPKVVWLLTIPEACRRLGVSRSTFYAKLSTPGVIPIRKMGSSSRVRSDDVDAFILGLPRQRLTSPTIFKDGAGQ